MATSKPAPTKPAPAPVKPQSRAATGKALSALSEMANRPKKK